MSAVVADSATAPALTGSIVPRQSPAATKSIITPPRTNSCACQSLTDAASALAPSVIGRTTTATPATYSADSRATLRRLPPETAARYVGSITPAQHGAKKATRPAAKAAAREPARRTSIRRRAPAVGDAL